MRGRQGISAAIERLSARLASFISDVVSEQGHLPASVRTPARRFRADQLSRSTTVPLLKLVLSIVVGVGPQSRIPAVEGGEYVLCRASRGPVRNAVQGLAFYNPGSRRRQTDHLGICVADTQVKVSPSMGAADNSISKPVLSTSPMLASTWKPGKTLYLQESCQSIKNTAALKDMWLFARLDLTPTS